MAASVYSLPSDDITATGISLATGTVDTAYPLAQLYDNRPDQLFAITTSGPCGITWDHGSSMTIGWVQLVNYAIDTASDVRFQRHTADSWGAPDVDAAITIPARTADGMPVPVWTDMSSYAAKRYSRLYIPANATSVIAIGEFKIWNTKRTLPTRNFAANYDESRTRPTFGGVSELQAQLIYDLSTTLRRWRYSWMMTSAMQSTLETWWNGAKGRVTPFGFVLDTAVNDAPLVRFDGELAIQHVASLRNVSLTLNELSYGIPPTLA